MRLSLMLWALALLVPALHADVVPLLQAVEPPAPTAAPETLPPDEAASLLEQLGLADGTRLTLVLRPQLPDGLVKVAVDCGVDAEVRSAPSSRRRMWCSRAPCAATECRSCPTTILRCAPARSTRSAQCRRSPS